MKLTYRAVIFDLDGTLLDTLADIAMAANDVLAALGQETHGIADYRFMVGDGVSMLFQRACPMVLEDRICCSAASIFSNNFTRFDGKSHRALTPRSQNCLIGSPFKDSDERSFEQASPLYLPMR